MLADACGELFQLLGPLLRDARLVGICKLHAPREMAFIVGRPSHSGETALQIIGGDRLVRGRPRVRRAFGCFICRSSVRDPSYRYADDDDEGSLERHASLRRFYRAQCIFGAAYGDVKDLPRRSQLVRRQREVLYRRPPMATPGPAFNPSSAATSQNPSPPQPPTPSPASTYRKARSKQPPP